MAFARRFTRRAAIVVGTLGAAGLAVVASQSLASDHQDTPFVEFNPRFDVNDVYAFKGSKPGRIALVLGTSSPLTPAGTPAAAFGDESQILYQLKVDNTGDAKEDLVFQITFTGPQNNQRVTLRGPVRPNEVGTANTIVDDRDALSGKVNTVLGSADGVQLFAGAREDPFFIDLEQFFRIIPDRRPEAGRDLPFETASSFRTAGAARDFLAGINDLAIVIELPESALTENGAKPRFGVWGTTSQPRAN